MAQQRGQIRWCACAENFVCDSSYFEMDPRCHWEPVKFIEQWFGTAQSIRLQNDTGQHVLLALKLSGQGLRHAIHDGVGVVRSGAHQSVSNQSGGVGIEDGTNVAKSSDVVLQDWHIRLTCLLKARDESMVTPSSLILSDMGMGEPLTSTWVMLSSDLLRGWVPRRMASDFSGFKARPLW